MIINSAESTKALEKRLIMCHFAQRKVKLITRPQRWSTFFYITYINSARTSLETQYITDL
jgi:hypothetical protein